jgi:hypothetical protein
VKKRRREFKSGKEQESVKNHEKKLEKIVKSLKQQKKANKASSRLNLA